MPGSFRIGTLLGIPLQLNISWFIIFGVVTYSLVAGQFPAQYPFWPTETYVVVGVITSLLFFISVIVHELSHSLVARFIGLPVKSITLFIFGGVAQISRDASRPAGELVMAAAGPFASFVLAGFFAVVWAMARSLHEPTTALTGWLAWINLSLGVFNLLPGFPMDGGRVLRSLLWWATGSRSTATKIAVSVGHLLAYLMLLAGIMMVLFDPRMMFNGIWFAFIGWFLNQAASGSSRHAQIIDALQGFSVRDVMSTALHVIPGEITLEQFISRYGAISPHLWYVVVEGPYLRGLLDLDDVKRVRRNRRATTTVTEAMIPLNKLSILTSDGAAVDALEEMDAREVARLPVVESGRLIGMVSHASLLRAGHIRRELGY